MKRKERRRLAFKWAKMEIKKHGVPRRQLYKFVKMFQDKLRRNPSFKYEEGA